MRSASFKDLSKSQASANGDIDSRKQTVVMKSAAVVQDFFLGFIFFALSIFFGNPARD